MNKREILQNALSVVAAHRQSAMDECDEILRELRTYDDFRVCEQKLKQAEIDVALYGKKGETETVDKYKCLLNKLLKKYGYAEADLHPQYSCELCQDTGYIGAKQCVCLQEEIRKIILRESNIQNVEYTFENSAETNKHNLAVYKKSREICEKNTLQNILLLGKNGTGKTYLLSACANLCVEAEKSVAFLTAYNLNSLFLECHLSDLATNRAVMDNLVDTDVLAVDDLGTEVVYKNVTAEYLFALLNERIQRGKQTFISSNLTVSDIRNRYDERLFSRLFDKKISFVAQLEGEDKRIE